MLGMRGVRLGLTVPEIYDMQARAIFEARGRGCRRPATPVVPEIMIPLVSARREVEIVKAPDRRGGGGGADRTRRRISTTASA